MKQRKAGRADEDVSLYMEIPEETTTAMKDFLFEGVQTVHLCREQALKYIKYL